MTLVITSKVFIGMMLLALAKMGNTEVRRRADAAQRKTPEQVAAGFPAFLGLVALCMALMFGSVACAVSVLLDLIGAP